MGEASALLGQPMQGKWFGAPAVCGRRGTFALRAAVISAGRETPYLPFASAQQSFVSAR